MFELIPFGNRERSVWSYLDNIEKAFFQGGFPEASEVKTDIVDAGDRFVLNAELPGFAKEDIKIDVEDGSLTIRAEKNEEKEENQGNYIRRERRSGSYARRFDLAGIRTEEISARYENGILSLELPKKEAQPKLPARQIEIQ